MQKKIIALAVAGLVSGAAFAQSSVTVYGLLDAGVYGWSGNDESATGVVNGGLSTSRLGFKGEEALGNGLKAIFTLETAVTTDGNSKDAGWGSNRQANVGLTGGFGTLLVGLQPSLSDNWHGGVSEPMGNISSRNLMPAVVGRFSNEKADGVAYYSPMFSGLQLGALYGTQYDNDRDGTTADDADRKAYVQVGAKYANGPFAAALTYARLNKANAESAAQDWTVGATYDFKVVKLFAAYELSQNVGANEDDNAVYTLGARVPVGKAGTITGSYSLADNDIKDTDTAAWQIGYEHALSKRTTAYASYMRLENDDAGGAVPNNRFSASSTAWSTPTTDESYNGVMVGIRHLF